MKTERIQHPFPPVINEASRVLVLGSFPSVQSREHAFYYGHAQNRFWRVLAELFHADLPLSIEEKISFLHQRHIAVGDAVAECEIAGSADSTLKPYAFIDIVALLETAKITHVFTNGRKADTLYTRNLEPLCGIPAVCLPSTSPANASWTTNRLVAAWAPLRTAVIECADP